LISNAIIVRQPLLLDGRRCVHALFCSLLSSFVTSMRRVRIFWLRCFMTIQNITE
jgi:hypothetical protein